MNLTDVLKAMSVTQRLQGETGGMVMEDMAWVLYAILGTQSFGLLMRLWRLNQARDYGEHDRRYARLSLSEFIAIRELLNAQLNDEGEGAVNVVGELQGIHKYLRNIDYYMRSDRGE